MISKPSARRCSRRDCRQSTAATAGRNAKRPAPAAGKNPEVIRFKAPEMKVELKDIVRGKVTLRRRALRDLIIAKDLDNPLYNFAVVVDD